MHVRLYRRSPEREKAQEPASWVNDKAFGLARKAERFRKGKAWCNEMTVYELDQEGKVAA